VIVDLHLECLALAQSLGQFLGSRCHHGLALFLGQAPGDEHGLDGGQHRLPSTVAAGGRLLGGCDGRPWAIATRWLDPIDESRLAFFLQ